jgi:hypothetical protein
VGVEGAEETPHNNASSETRGVVYRRTEGHSAVGSSRREGNEEKLTDGQPARAFLGRLE